MYFCLISQFEGQGRAIVIIEILEFYGCGVFTLIKDEVGLSGTVCIQKGMRQRYVDTPCVYDEIRPAG